MPSKKPGPQGATSHHNTSKADPEFAEYVRHVSESADVRTGSPLPLGAHPWNDGANFAVFSRNANQIWLELFDRATDSTAARSILLDPDHHRTGDVWHVWVRGIRPGQLYGYRVDGPYQPEAGHRFNCNKLLLDPLTGAVSLLDHWEFGPALGYDPSLSQGDLSFSETDDAGAMPKSIFTNEHFDWGGDQPLQRTWSDTVIYETHVRGLTIHDTSGVDAPGVPGSTEHTGVPGTYRGMVAKIPYLRELGVTAVELMPTQEFNENGLSRTNPTTGKRLKNYWGYDPVVFLAPKASYSSAGGLGQQKLEFKEMVKAFHQAGIEVILDVVFNHTAEGNELGPTICFRGLDNDIFYMQPENKRYYKDFTGTGNTIDASHPVVQDMILDALRHWVIEMHVDGFRFDLASVLGRDEAGNLLPNAPLLERIAEDPILRRTKIIAEAWDAAGAYQVGSFSEQRWAEWNGRYRDDVRRFWRGDGGMVGAFASRICGSADIYQGSGKGPESSINFITCHDGFTLNDLVSYRQKHNEANGEDNRDGSNANDSDNYGVEGETDDPGIEAVRQRQIKNFFLTLFISRGVPMLLGGDEFRRTQQGNNNAYCQDNETSWYNWTFLERYQDIHRFVQGMIAFRRTHPVLRREAFYAADDVRWFNPEGADPDWSDPEEKCLACLILGQDEPALYLMFNAGTKAATFVLPGVPSGRMPSGGRWYLAADTSRPSPQDLLEADHQIALDDPVACRLQPRSSVILVAHPPS
jgi:isoamylase